MSRPVSGPTNQQPEEEGKCQDDEEPTHLRCAGCQEIILTVPRRVARAFASGTWTCASEKCHRRRAAQKAAAEGELDLTSGGSSPPTPAKTAR